MTDTDNRYHDQVSSIIEGFRFELCAECHGDLDAHTIAPDPLGNAHAWCRLPEREIELYFIGTDPDTVATGLPWTDYDSAQAGAFENGMNVYYVGACIRVDTAELAWTPDYHRDADAIPAWGLPYGSAHDPAYLTPDGPVWMHRKGQRVRFYDRRGDQVGPEQSNVAPAVAYAIDAGWQAVV